jgi:Cu/Zn superoxide dismutase
MLLPRDRDVAAKPRRKCHRCPDKTQFSARSSGNEISQGAHDAHKGDLPVVQAGAKGSKVTVTAPHLSLAGVRGPALIMHEGGDNDTDNPENGGDAGRLA